MKFSLRGIGALAFCISVTAQAASTRDISAATIASKFVGTLQHQHFIEAAAMLSPNRAEGSSTTERTLKRIGGIVGGFSTMRLIPTLPNGKSIKLEVLLDKTIVPQSQQFFQLRYASIASDGQPVFYEVNLSADNIPAQILSFGVHFPASDDQSTARANHLVSLITR